MTWKLKLVDSDKKLTELEPGDIMFVDHYKEFCEKPGEAGELKHRFFSDRYLRDDYYKRDPLLICLPDGHHWCIDQVATNGVEGWQVSGEVPPWPSSQPSWRPDPALPCPSFPVLLCYQDFRCFDCLRDRYLSGGKHPGQGRICDREQGIPVTPGPPQRGSGYRLQRLKGSLSAIRAGTKASGTWPGGWSNLITITPWKAGGPSSRS
jgi:hypothetical protein